MVRPKGAYSAIATAAILIAQQVAGRAARDSLFLTEFNAEHLPRVMLASAALSLVGSFAAGPIMLRIGPRSTAVGLAIIGAVLFGFEAWLLSWNAPIAAIVTYLHVSVIGALLVSAFWSSFNERFDPHTAKQLVAQVTSGAAFGGMAGGLVMHFLADRIDLGTALLLLAVVNIGAAYGSWSVGRSRQRGAGANTEGSALKTLRDDAYLRRVATMVAVLGAAGVLVDFALKAEAERTFESSAALLSFFAAFYTLSSLSTFILQAGLARRLLKRFGLTRVIATLPVALGVTAAIGAAIPQLITSALAHLSRSSFSNSLFRSGYELLYTPVDPNRKRSAKTFIDVACDQLGDAAGSLLVLLIVGLAAAASTTWSLASAAVLSIVALGYIATLHRGYVSQLATSLRTGIVSLEASHDLDATTLRTFAETTQALSREQVLSGIESLRRSQAALEKPAENAPYLVELLGDSIQSVAARSALEELGEQAVEPLADGLRDRNSDPLVRRRIPLVLRKIDEPLAIDALIAGLDDPVFRVRRRCAQALAAKRREGSAIPDVRGTVFTLVAQELAEERATDKGSVAADTSRPEANVPEDIAGATLRPMEEQLSEIERLLQKRDDRKLEHVFTLLSLTLPREPIIDSLRALSSEDIGVRGTALEYLDNVLPPELKQALSRHLSQRDVAL